MIEQLHADGYAVVAVANGATPRLTNQ